MPNVSPGNPEYVRIATYSQLLAFEGKEVRTGLPENGVYLARDGFVYHIKLSEDRRGLRAAVAGKRSVGEYLRWVDGLFKPGELPAATNAIHYRAARQLRELI